MRQPHLHAAANNLTGRTMSFELWYDTQRSALTTVLRKCTWNIGLASSMCPK